MANVDEIYARYLTAAEVGSNTIRMKIGGVEPVDLRQQDGSTRKKLVLYFNGQDRPMVLNRTNAGTLAAAFGKNTDGWVDQRVEVFSEMTSLGKPGLRIRVPRVNPPPNDINDEITF
jgi:hypothetical protein